jgi:glycerate dehydrogenase
VNIVIVDGFTTNPGDLSWDAFRQLGDVAVYDRTSPEQAYARSRDADIIITNKVAYDAPLLARLPKLKYLGVIATGYNVVDLDYTRRHDIVVTNVSDYCTGSVAQMAWAHIFELARRIGHHDRTVREGRWTSSPDFCYWDFAQIDMTAKTLGLVGCGNIGRAVARIAMAMDMNVIAHDPYPQAAAGIEFVDLDALFARSDVVSLHCLLTAETKGMINLTNLRKMKKSAFLINTGRGGLVNEQELALALNEGVIAGAGLDVLSVEPPAADNPLFRAANCYMTPHIAWSSGAARRKLIELAAGNVRAFLAGQPVNRVNGP